MGGAGVEQPIPSHREVDGESAGGLHAIPDKRSEGGIRDQD